MSAVNFQRRFIKHSKDSSVKITTYQLRHYFGTEYLKIQSRKVELTSLDI